MLLPGLVDSHVHVNEPGRTHWEGFASATRAAVAGGVTTIVDMPLNSIPPTVTVEALHVKRETANGQVAADVAFWGGAVPGNVDQLRPMLEAGVVGFKCFLLDSGVPEFPPLDDAGSAGRARRNGGRRRAADRPRRGRRRDRGRPRARPARATPASWRPARERPRRRPSAGSSRRPATPGRGCTSSTSPTPTRCRCSARARADGVRITVETCPHYLTFAAEEVPDGATSFKCCPPIREAAHREALWAALRDGDVDLVVSDHSPCTPDLKRLDDRRLRRRPGAASPRCRWRCPRSGPAPARAASAWTEVVRWMAEAPARLAGLSAKGAIAVGKDADLVAFAPDERWTVGELSTATR